MIVHLSATTTFPRVLLERGAIRTWKEENEGSATMTKRNRLGAVSEMDGDSDATISEDSEGEDIPHGSNT